MNESFWQQQTPAFRVSLKATLFAFGAGGVRLVADYVGSVVLAVLATIAIVIAIGVGVWAIFFLPNR
jgi:hypothetical protein